MTPEQTALVSRAEVAFGHRFEQLGVPNPQQAAADAIGWLIRNGWRPWPALADTPPPRRAEPAATAAEHLAAIRAVLDEKRGNRPEQETRP